MNSADIKGAVTCISGIMDENKDYLVSLDQQNGDGDLGISMSCGFRAVADYLSSATEEDIGRLLMKCSSVFNENAPSSLGTILSFGMIGMARALKGMTEVSLAELSQAMEAGVRLIMDKAGSKPGEKTVLDALCPAVDTLVQNSDKDCKEAFTLAAQAAAAGSESTKAMRPVHGRAAYYGDKSIGLLDGGSVVGKLIFEGIETYCASL